MLQCVKESCKSCLIIKSSAAECASLRFLKVTQDNRCQVPILVGQRNLVRHRLLY